MSDIVFEYFDATLASMKASTDKINLLPQLRNSAFIQYGGFITGTRRDLKAMEHDCRELNDVISQVQDPRKQFNSKHGQHVVSEMKRLDDMVERMHAKTADVLEGKVGSIAFRALTRGCYRRIHEFYEDMILLIESYQGEDGEYVTADELIESL